MGVRTFPWSSTASKPTRSASKRKAIVARNAEGQEKVLAGRPNRAGPRSSPNRPRRPYPVSGSERTFLYARPLWKPSPRRVLHEAEQGPRPPGFRLHDDRPPDDRARRDHRGRPRGDEGP